LPPHLEALFDFIEHVCARVERGGVPYFQKEWLKDDATDMAALLAKYDEHDPKYSLMRAVGENLPSVIRGETTMLEHMTKDDKLGNFYKKASSHQISNNFTANIAGQIAHRYPHMDICEVGAGTGGATGGILANLGTAFASYTYTDISSGFFANAQERFAAYGSRMIYKTLDISQDPTTQGFAEASYDVVFAANVLHATPRLEETLRNVRRLLKPGGYLVLMEIIETGLFRNGLIFGGLPGWWIGRDEGRRYAPTIELHKWHSVLLNTGFSGVETVTPMDDPVAREIGVFASRAVDDDITLLRDPLLSSQSPSSERNSTLVILGGGTATTKHVVDDLVNTLEKRYKQVICASSWEELCDIEVPEGSSLLTLTDRDGTAFWKNITARVFEKFKKLMLESKNVIWTTWGFDRENPDGAMTVGFFRSLAFDLPGSQLQIIDLEKPDDVESKFLAESMLRLEVTEGWRRKGIFDTKLWTTEPEIRVRKGRVLIPRVVPQRQQNDRFNSTRRDIQKDVDMRKSVVELTSTDDGKYALREDESRAVPSIPGHRRVRVTLSMLSSLATSAGRFYFGLGEDIDTGERVVSASLKNASAISVPNRWSVLVDVGKGIDAQYLSFFAGHVMSQRLASLVPPSGRLLVYEPDPGLASRVARRLSSQGSQPPLFTTSSTELLTKKRRNWFHLHPRITDRHLKASLPSHTDVYLDFSSWPTAAASEQQGTLGARIAQMTPQLCVKYDLSALITPGSVCITRMTQCIRF
jgi:SAM-dependent methyltransferase